MLHDIWKAPTREGAGKASELFGKTFEAKYQECMKCLQKDRDALLMFFDFPAENWFPKECRTFWPRFVGTGTSITRLMQSGLITPEQLPHKYRHEIHPRGIKDEPFYLRKMKFPKVKDPEAKRSVNDRTTVIYNDYITVRDIPLEAYDYVVNGKSAIEWVMERQAVSTDKQSGIVNDANLCATETTENAAYPLELILRVITVSLETMKIVNSLPKLDID